MKTIKPKSNGAAPPSSSKFSMHYFYSNRSGAHGSPRRCDDKLKYDFAFDGASNPKRIEYKYISANAAQMPYVQGIVEIGRKCRMTAGRQCNSRQMGHMTLALPAELNEAQRRSLVAAICDFVHQDRDGVPVYGVVHRPDEENDNVHLHLSHPIRRLTISHDGRIDFGERILCEQRPHVRMRSGLHATTHAEMRRFRSAVAAIIADSLKAANIDNNIVERWRHGHARLSTQVVRASQRGDVQFVLDHALRDPTSHRGPSGSQFRNVSDRTPNYTGAVGTQIESERLRLTKSLDFIISTARRLKLNDPSYLRLLALDHDTIIKWYRKRLKGGRLGRVSGVSIKLLNGTRSFAGHDVGYAFSRLRKNFEWTSDTEFELRWLEVRDDYSRIQAMRFNGRQATRGDAHFGEIVRLSSRQWAQDLLNRAREISGTSPDVCETAFLDSSTLKSAAKWFKTLDFDLQHQMDRLKMLLIQIGDDALLGEYVREQLRDIEMFCPSIDDIRTPANCVTDETSVEANGSDTDGEEQLLQRHYRSVFK